MTDITVSKIDAHYIRVNCDRSIARELSEYFTFDVPGAKFMPQVKSGFWDGKIRLFNVNTSRIYYGLHHHVRLFSENNGYTFQNDISDAFDEISIEQALSFIQTLQLPSNIKVRPYQLKAFIHSVRNRRLLVMSPTASGKSLIIYMLIRWFLENEPDARPLIIVPTVNLVNQLFSDFTDDYGWDGETYCHKIYEGQPKTTTKPVVISTWQSIFNLPRKFFDKFNILIGDEAHLYDSKSLTGVLEKLTYCNIRIGLSGTLKGTKTNALILQGLFGPIYVAAKTAELIEQGYLTKPKIKILILKHTKDNCKLAATKKFDYASEIDFLCAHNERNKFIMDLASATKGNTLILFQRVETHGLQLYTELQKRHDDVFYIHGGIKGDKREIIRQYVKSRTNCKIAASFGTFSTGVNIPNLHNIILASPTKSAIRLLQSLGRGLRLHDSKSSLNVYDIADDMSQGKRLNTTLKHSMERIKIYADEQFEYKIYKHTLKS